MSNDDIVKDNNNISQAALDPQAAKSPSVPGSHDSDQSATPANDTPTDKQPTPIGTDRQETKPDSASDDDDITVKYTAPPSESEALKAANEKIERLESQLYMQGLGVDMNHADDILTLAKSRVNKETTIKGAIDAVIKTYPNFITKPAPSITPSVSISNDSVSHSEDAFEMGIRGIANINTL